MTETNLHRYRSHTCGALRASDIDANVRLSGWVHRVRDHGGVLFIDLRDHYGITQVLADPDNPAYAEMSSDAGMQRPGTFKGKKVKKIKQLKKVKCLVKNPYFK